MTKPLYIPLRRTRMTETAVWNAHEVLQSGKLEDGPFLDRFETAMAEYLGFPVLAFGGTQLGLYSLLSSGNRNGGTISEWNTPKPTERTSGRMTELCASIALGNLEGLKEAIERTQRNHLAYDGMFGQTSPAVDFSSDGTYLLQHPKVAELQDRFREEGFETQLYMRQGIIIPGGWHVDEQIRTDVIKLVKEFN